MVKKTRIRDFGDPTDNEEEESEPVYFKLAGQEFECYSEIGGYTLLELTSKLTNDDEAVDGLLSFFKAVLVEESFIRFEKLAKDPKKKIRIETLSDIISYVMEEYTDRDPKA